MLCIASKCLVKKMLTKFVKRNRSERSTDVKQARSCFVVIFVLDICRWLVIFMSKPSFFCHFYRQRLRKISIRPYNMENIIEVWVRCSVKCRGPMEYRGIEFALGCVL